MLLQERVNSTDEPLTRRPGSDPDPAGPLVVLGQNAAAVPPARRYRHRPAGLQVLLSDYDHAVAECIRVDHRLAVAEITAGRTATAFVRSQSESKGVTLLQVL